MNAFEEQISYWAHMLDECKLDEGNKTTFANVDNRDDLDSKKNPLETALKVLGDDTYNEFVDDLNMLMKYDSNEKIKRLKDALIKQFNSGDIEIQYNENEIVDIRSFKATQNEVCISNSLSKALLEKDPAKQTESLFPDDGIVKLGPPICAAAIRRKDGKEQYYVIDGHHRWSQACCFNPTAKIAAYVIRSSSFKEPDDILKFVQMEIFVHTADKKKQLPSAKGSGDDSNNLFKASDDQIRAACTSYMDQSFKSRGIDGCSAKYLYPKMKEVSSKNLSEDQIISKYQEMRDFITSQIVKNVYELKEFGQYPDQHDRSIMPQTGSDMTGVANDHHGILGPDKADNTQPLDLKESKLARKYTRRQIAESIKYWENYLKTH